MRLHKINNVVHRDLGYLVAGATILYAVSGLALNHVSDWNPNFVIDRQEIATPIPDDMKSISRAWVFQILEPLGETANYRSHDFASSSKLKIYLDDGSVLIDLKKGKGLYETVRRRPILYQLNCLHVSPRKTWLCFSDLFAGSLLIVVITGLFVIRGNRGITGRGAILAAAGLLIPLGFLFSIQ
jgi:hypothetical protein